MEANLIQVQHPMRARVACDRLVEAGVGVCHCLVQCLRQGHSQQPFPITVLCKTHHKPVVETA
eukprot:317504-Amphidinium_carterae.1